MVYTDGLSYNDVEAMVNGGTLDGWRFAREYEFGELMASAIGGPYTDFFDPAQYLPMVNLINLMGFTYDGSSQGDYWAFATGYVDSTGFTYAYARQFGYQNSQGGYVRPEYQEFVLYKTDSDATKGAFLVRTSVVPVPAALWLFGSGLLGLVGIASKKAA